MTASLFPFVRNRFRHELLESDGDVCLVARTNLVTGSLHWEVVVLQHDPPRTLPSGQPAPATRYPRSSEWGTSGWTYTTRPDATQKYRSLLSAMAQKGGSVARGRA